MTPETEVKGNIFHFDLWKLAYHVTDVISIWFTMKECFIYVGLTSASHHNLSTLSQKHIVLYLVESRPILNAPGVAAQREPVCSGPFTWRM